MWKGELFQINSSLNIFSTSINLEIYLNLWTRKQYLKIILSKYLNFPILVSTCFEFTINCLRELLNRNNVAIVRNPERLYFYYRKHD